MTNSTDDYVHLAKLRLDWASAGIERLEVLVDSFLATKPCEVIRGRVKHEEETARISYVLRVYRPPPPTIRFAVGDVVHNLRASLDNLVWGVGQVFKASKRLGLEFHESEASFQDCYLPKIRKLPDPTREWITSIQPYQRGTHIVLFENLHNLWNRDKHRTPTVINTAGVTEGTLGYFDDQVPLFKSLTFYNVSGQKDRQRIVSAVIPWERRSEFKPEFSPLVAFNEDGPIGLNIMRHSVSVVDHLRHVQKYTLDNVVPKFEPYL